MTWPWSPKVYLIKHWSHNPPTIDLVKVDTKGQYYFVNRYATSGLFLFGDGSTSDSTYMWIPYNSQDELGGFYRGQGWVAKE